VRSLADFDALIVRSRNRKAELVAFQFDQLCGYRYALTDLRRSQVPHVHMDAHNRTQVPSIKPIIAGVENTSEVSCLARISGVVT
jgi:hypothetical protein